MSESEEQTQDLQAALDSQLYHCQRLLEAVTDCVTNWRENGGRAFADVPDVLIHAVFARSTRTYEAVVEHLGNRGFGEQAAMRLFEDMVDAHWIALNPATAIERLRQHHRYSQALRLDVARQFPEYFGEELPDLDPPMTEDERKELVGHFGKWGDGSWTGLGSHVRWRAIESAWTSELAQRQARFFRLWIQRTNNETLHVSAYSLANIGSPKFIDGALHFQLGSTEKLLGPALFCAFWTYVQTVWLVLDRFELELNSTVVEPGLAALAAASRPAI